MAYSFTHHLSLLLFRLFLFLLLQGLISPCPCHLLQPDKLTAQIVNLDPRLAFPQDINAPVQMCNDALRNILDAGCPTPRTVLLRNQTNDRVLMNERLWKWMDAETKNVQEGFNACSAWRDCLALHLLTGLDYRGNIINRMETHWP